MTEQLVLCPYCARVVATFAAHNPHADIASLRRARWHGCCRYWLARGIPEGWFSPHTDTRETP